MYPTASVNIVNKQKSQQGDTAETVESIMLMHQDITLLNIERNCSDYAIITKNIYDNADSVVAYGGDPLNPPMESFCCY